jgi:hypothetical protein
VPCAVAVAAGVTVPPPGVEAPLPWVDPHAAPDRRHGPEEHQGTVRCCQAARCIAHHLACPLPDAMLFHAGMGVTTAADPGGHRCRDQTLRWCRRPTTGCALSSTLPPRMCCAMGPTSSR